MAQFANWSYPTNVRFGAGRIGELADACAAAGMSRPLFVTDAGLAGSEIAARALDALEADGKGRAVFSGVAPNPDETHLMAALEAFRAGGHDGVVGFGGGSAIDLARCVALMDGQTRPVFDFEDREDWWTRADASAIRPLVAVPTTAGTGSEVGRSGLLIDTSNETKKIIFHPKLMPAAVIADPELTVGLPPSLTAGTGMDAFAHCLEAYSSPHFHPMSAGIALEGMRLAKDNLPRVMKDPTDIEARGEMMAAAMMGAVAFQKGLGAIHALSHPIGALYDTHHGTTNAVVMAEVFKFNKPAIEAKMEAAAAYLGLSGGYNGVLGLIETLCDDLDMPADLTALGVPRDREADIVEMALKDPSAGGNPVPLTRENTAALLDACFG